MDMLNIQNSRHSDLRSAAGRPSTGQTCRPHLAALIALVLARPAFAQGPLEQGPAPITKLPDSTYVLVYEDRFDGDAVDQERWNFRLDERTGVNINGLNRRENVSVESGSLKVRSESEQLGGQLRHTGGGLISKKNFGYGYYETRARPYMGARGLHSAFWSRGVSAENYRNTIFEIDGFEIDSPRKHSTQNLYIVPNSIGKGEAPWPHRANLPIALDKDGWLTLGYDYTPAGVAFYLNGKLTSFATYPQDTPELVAQQNVWLTALNGVGTVDTDKGPGFTYFDYFRFYSRKFPQSNILPNGDFEYNRDQQEAPIAWREAGDIEASNVVQDVGAKSGRNILRQGLNRKFSVNTNQTLSYLLDGTYTLSFWTRTSKLEARSQLSIASGDQRRTVPLPRSEAWTKVVLEDVIVKGGGISFELKTTGEANAYSDFDVIEFYDGPEHLHSPPTYSYNPEVDPVWRIFEKSPVRFDGDDKFYFFNRYVGYGDTITVSVRFNAADLQTTQPVARTSAEGTDGWAVGLKQDGSVYCLIGSQKSHVRASSGAVYRPGIPMDVACVKSATDVTLYVDGKRTAVQQLQGFGTNDMKVAGKVGATAGAYDAVGDVTGGNGGVSNDAARRRNFYGDLSRLMIFNRALSNEELVELSRSN